LEGLKKWVALLATITLLLLSLLSGLISAAAAADNEPAAEEQSTIAGGETTIVPAPDTPVEEPVTQEPAAVQVVLTQPDGTLVGGEQATIPEEGTPEPEAAPGGGDAVFVPYAGILTPAGVPDPTSLTVTKTVAGPAVPVMDISLTKTTPDPTVTLSIGVPQDVSFEINLGGTALNSYRISGTVTVTNDPNWPAHVTDVSDHVIYKIGNTEYFVPMTFTSSTFPTTPYDIPAGATVTYNYEGVFTLPPGVDIFSVGALKNEILITISNHPDGYHTFHNSPSIPKPTSGGTSIVRLTDVESINPASGVSYAVKSVTINGTGYPSSPLYWDLNLANGPFKVVIVKTLTASQSGDYVLHNVADAGGKSAFADVNIHVDAGQGNGSICGTKYEDVDGDGDGDYRVPNVTIKLYDASGALVRTTITDANGDYCFNGLPLGDYIVKEFLDPGWHAVNPASGERAVRLANGGSGILDAGILCWPPPPPRVTGVDFINARWGRICGTKYEDVDGDGEGENGVPGITIELYNATGLVRTTTTGANGNYCFDGLPLGDYTVKEVLGAGWCTVDPVSGERSVHLGYGDSGIISAGILCCPPPPPPPPPWVTGVDFVNCHCGSITGLKFKDLDADGALDPGEPGFPNVTIQLKQGNTVVKTTTTGADGRFTFSDVKPGTYDVVEVLGGGIFTKISTIISGVVVTPGAAVTLDSTPFLNYQLGSITGLKYEDMDADGQFDVGEPAFPNVTIQLKQGTTVIATTTTGADGRFTFTNVIPGTYDVVEVLGGGIFTKISTIISGVVVTSGATVCLDRTPFLNYEKGSITGLKFRDMNANGLKDPADTTPWEGITIQLKQGSTVVKTTTTGATGRFTFTGVEPGTYDVVEDLSLTPGAYTKASTIIAGVVVTSGATVNLDSTPFLNYEKVSISGLRNEDLDADGVLEDKEPGVAEVTINLKRSNSVSDTIAIKPATIVVDSVTTGSDGKFTFADVEPGIYDIEEVLDTGVFTKISTIITGVVVYSGQETVLEGDFFLNYRLGSITGYKYEDLDADGIFDSGEPGYANVTINLKQGTTVVKTATTGSDGKFVFVDLEPGTYDIEEVLTTGVFTKISQVISGVVVTSGAETVLEKEFFLNYKLGSITGYKYNDINGDGVLDSGDQPWDGSKIPISIKLWQGSTPVKTTSVGADGTYGFTDLVPGVYTIKEAQAFPSGVGTNAKTEITATVESGKVYIVPSTDYFLNFVLAVAPVVIQPEVTPQPQGQLPTTGWNQLPLLLAAGLLMLLGLISLMLGVVQLRRS